MSVTTAADDQTAQLEPVRDVDVSDGRIELAEEDGCGIARWFDAKGNKTVVVLYASDNSFVALESDFSLSGGSLITSPGVVAMLAGTYLDVGHAASVTITSDLPFGDDYKDGGRFWTYLKPDYVDLVKIE